MAFCFFSIAFEWVKVRNHQKKPSKIRKSPGVSHHLLIEVPERCRALLQNAQRGALPEELSSEPGGAGDWCNIYYHLCMDSLWIV